MIKGQKFPPPSAVAVDVDDTLINPNGQPDPRVVEYIRLMKQGGREVYVWSARGRAHAEEAVARAGIADLVDACISKPGMIIDDQGWAWVHYTLAYAPHKLPPVLNRGSFLPPQPRG